MADATAIEWTDATWNPITGCTLVSDGCRHCYAATLAAGRLQHHASRAGLARRNAAGEARFTGEVRFNAGWLDKPLRWRRPRRVFVCAHGDLFHEAVPDEWIDRVFAVMALAPQHTFQVLTKRPERARAYLLEIPHRQSTLAAPASLDGARFPLPNVWLGTSVEDQATADARIPHLLDTPAAVRFVSAEPLLGPVDLNSCDLAFGLLDWIIVGGESGPGARPMHPDWARSLRDQCQAASVPFFFKQWGAWAPRRTAQTSDMLDTERSVILRPDGGITSGLMTYGVDAWVVDRTGKARAGRSLDGLTWDQMPEAEGC